MKRVTHSFKQINQAPPDQVFPLLCPVQEAKWVPGWKYRLVYSKSGVAELGCVFATPNEDGSESTWVVTHYDPEGRSIAFVWTWPKMIATRLNIVLKPEGETQTAAHLSYEYTALSAEGEREVELYDRAWFEAKMKGWQTALNHYLETGKLLRAEGWE